MPSCRLRRQVLLDPSQPGHGLVVVDTHSHVGVGEHALNCQHVHLATVVAALSTQVYGVGMDWIMLHRRTSPIGQHGAPWWLVHPTVCGPRRHLPKRTSLAPIMSHRSASRCSLFARPAPSTPAHCCTTSSRTCKRSPGQLRQQLFVHVCRPTDVEMLHLEPATFFSIEKEDEVQLPSCPAMRDAGLETYYGNLALPPRRCARRKR